MSVLLKYLFLFGPLLRQHVSPVKAPLLGSPLSPPVSESTGLPGPPFPCLSRPLSRQVERMDSSACRACAFASRPRGIREPVFLSLLMCLVTFGFVATVFSFLFSPNECSCANCGTSVYRLSTTQEIRCE